MSTDERFDRLETELQRLGAEIRQLKQQQQQMEVRRPRRWYQRVVETWISE
jgi:phage shock protein A